MISYIRIKALTPRKGVLNNQKLVLKFSYKDKNININRLTVCADLADFDEQFQLFD